MRAGAAPRRAIWAIRMDLYFSTGVEARRKVGCGRTEASKGRRAREAGSVHGAIDAASRHAYGVAGGARYGGGAAGNRGASEVMES